MAVFWGQLLLRGGWSQSEVGAAMSPRGQQPSLGPVGGGHGRGGPLPDAAHPVGSAGPG